MPRKQERLIEEYELLNELVRVHNLDWFFVRKEYARIFDPSDNEPTLIETQIQKSISKSKKRK